MFDRRHMNAMRIADDRRQVSGGHVRGNGLDRARQAGTAADAEDDASVDGSREKRQLHGIAAVNADAVEVDPRAERLLIHCHVW